MLKQMGQSSIAKSEALHFPSSHHFFSILHHENTDSNFDLKYVWFFHKDISEIDKYIPKIYFQN